MTSPVPLRPILTSLRRAVPCVLRRVGRCLPAIALALFLLPPPAQGQDDRRPNPDALTSESFSASGLRNASLMTHLYRGTFTEITLERDDIRFAALYNAYLEGYSTQCRAHLPADNVEMTRQVCTRWLVTRNGWGVETNRSCVNWQTVGTGQYAAPVLLAAKRELDLLNRSDAFRHVIGLMSADDPIAQSMNMAGQVNVLRADVAALLRLNDCDSPGLKRFEDNLRAFALNERPTRLSGEPTPSSILTPPPGERFVDQDYTRLLDDLIVDQSKTWVMNRYLRGSISGASVSARDARGRPTKIVAQYLYNGFSGRSRGSVTLTFRDGWPKCLYFFDNPAACRTPDRRIAAAYAEGAYRP